MKVVYFAQDLADPAVHRRIRMLREGFDEIVLLGFRRSAAPVGLVEGVPTIDLGRTISAQLIHRTGCVLAVAATLHRYRTHIVGAHVVMGRNLEMLVLAALARRRYAPSASLVFECLDIHWTMTTRSPFGAAIRQIEGRLLRQCDLLMVSAPDYITRYFQVMHKRLPPVWVAENKMLEAEVAADLPVAGTLPSGPPWRIGMFCQMRCRESVLLLAKLAARLPEQVHVVLQGSVATEIFPDFHQLIRGKRGIEYRGPYDRRVDLPGMYADVHFVWAIDFYGAHGNSDKLLPNRLYEALAYGVIPIADQSVATGRWLERFRTGVRLTDPFLDQATRFFADLDATAFDRLRATAAVLPRSAYISSAEECRQMCASMTSSFARSRVGTSRPLRRIV
ncbi:MAG: hypothetical protein AB7F35_20760 [Acetobacteraceae bacterium]